VDQPSAHPSANSEPPAHAQPSTRQWILFVSLALAAAAALLGRLLVAGPATVRWPGGGLGGTPALALRLDGLSAVMGLLVCALAWAVLRFSRRQLAGDPQERRYYRWFGATFLSVLLLVWAGDLLLFFAAWVSTSLCLHRLLLLYADRPGAVFAARKKFVISRLGDLCLVAAMIGIDRAYGTWDFAGLFAAVESGNTAGLPAICAWLAAGAALKSAQVPFHSWLPETMETPTPVSAFMHAGIINAGGFLVIRLSPLFVHAPGALAFLAVAGAVTAAFGCVVMLTQPGVKRSLAFSTVGQMGFMLLECGLGAFSLALLHLVAHSVYKAHAFLTSGSTVGAPARAAVPLRNSTLIAALILVSGAGAVTGAWGQARTPAQFFPIAVLGLSAAYGMARAWSASPRPSTILAATGAGLGFLAAGLGLHFGANALFPSPAVPTPLAVIGFCSAVFCALFLFQATLWRLPRHLAGRALYIHALNGFYVGTFNNRLLRLLWPASHRD
jgi:NAD(P)H-quinone oxidoreductase subunit 5